jgi:hypothetical protein
MVATAPSSRQSISSIPTVHRETVHGYERYPNIPNETQLDSNSVYAMVDSSRVSNNLASNPAVPFIPQLPDPSILQTPEPSLDHVLPVTGFTDALSTSFPFTTYPFTQYSDYLSECDGNQDILVGSSYNASDPTSITPPGPSSHELSSNPSLDWNTSMESSGPSNNTPSTNPYIGEEQEPDDSSWEDLLQLE